MLDNFLTSGHAFNEHQNLLRYRILFFNIILLSLTFFMLIISINIYLNAPQEAWNQVELNLFSIAILLIIMALLRVNLNFYIYLATAMMILSEFVIAKGVVLVPSDNFVLNWFLIGQVIAFSLIGNRGGVIYSIVALMIVVYLFNHDNIPYLNSLSIITYIIQTFLVGAISYFFTLKITRTQEILVQQHKGLDDIVQERTREIESLLKELEAGQTEVLITVASILEGKSKETALHLKRVAEYSAILAKHYGLPQSDIDLLMQTSPMHDVGKVGIPDQILHKSGKLSETEYEIMKIHTKVGFDMFKESESKLLKASGEIAYTHHEKFDGSGYPRGLQAEEIPLFGRIVAVADVFDALGTARMYKEPWSDESIFDYLKEQRSKHFDPKLIDLFFKHLDEILAVRTRLS
jgi:response regulator RpfG family c-di-GMP phosphodiesterase